MDPPFFYWAARRVGTEIFVSSSKKMRQKQLFKVGLCLNQADRKFHEPFKGDPFKSANE